MAVPLLWGWWAKKWAAKVAARKGAKMKQEIVGNIIVRILSANALANYRRWIGGILLALGALVAFLTSPDLIGLCQDATEAFCGWVKGAQPFALAVGGWLAAAGTWLRKVKYVPKP